MQKSQLYIVCGGLENFKHASTVLFLQALSRVADLQPDPVGSGSFWSDLYADPDVWDRIRIQATNNGIVTVLVEKGIVNTYIEIYTYIRQLLSS
jgi:hypothetical protein